MDSVTWARGSWGGVLGGLRKRSKARPRLTVALAPDCRCAARLDPRRVSATADLGVNPQVGVNPLDHLCDFPVTLKLY